MRQARPGVSLPAYDRAAAKTGIVHIGLGAFHRAHQARYVDALLARDPRWAIAAVSLRNPAIRNALLPQDNLYVLATLDGEVPQMQVIGALSDVAVAPENPARVLAHLASPDVRAVTITVTEAGYMLGADGALDRDHPDLARDRATPERPATLIGYLVEGLRLRKAANLTTLDIISCDNLSENGARLRDAVLAFAGERDAALAEWIAGTARFPRTMVDSIVPATDDALRARVRAETGLEDAWPVQREAFSQWVIEDVLTPGGPDWAAVGVTLTDDVGGYEGAKLRILNASHSTLAYVGTLRGHETVSAAMKDAALRAFVIAMMREDVVPTLRAPKGLDLPAYCDAVVARFDNPAIQHRLVQIAMDGSLKLPLRILPTVQAALAMGRKVGRLAAPLAAWMLFLRAKVAKGATIADPMADALAAAARGCSGEASGDIARFLTLEKVFPRALAGAQHFVTALENAYTDLQAGRLPHPD